MTSAASDFIAFIQWLNDWPIPYFIAWGYEKLPEETSGGDVDVYVHPTYYSMVAEELTRKGYSSANCPASDGDHNHAQFSRIGSHSIDLFSSFCFAFMGKTTVLSITIPNLLLHGRRKNKLFWIASPIIEVLFNSLRIVGGRKDCMKRIKKYLRSE